MVPTWGPWARAEPGPAAPSPTSAPRLDRRTPVTEERTSAPLPAFTAGPVPLDRVLAGQPPPLQVEVPLAEVQAGRRLVVLDDDPTGTQSIADLPVLTSWS